MYQAARLTEVVRQVTGSLELAQLCKYTYSLAKRFNTFYHKYHILSETDLKKKQHLLLVADLVRKQLQYALHLIGSDVPQRM